MGKFLNLITAANAASAAASAYGIRQQQEDYAQEAWERDEAKKEREEEKSREREQRQASTEEKKERERRWDYKTEGIRGGIETIMKYRDPRFRLKLLQWHKEGDFRTPEEVEEINALTKQIGDSIITEQLKSILRGEFDDLWEENGVTPDPESALERRIEELNILGRDDVIQRGFYSPETEKSLSNVFEEYEALLRNLEKKKSTQLLVESEQSFLKHLTSLKKYPNKLIGGVFGKLCEHAPSNRKWWMRGVFLFILPTLWFILLPIYFLLWWHFSLKLSKDIRYFNLKARDAKRELDLIS